MATRTRFLSRLIGLYLILISLAMFANKQATLESMTALIHNPPVLFVVAVMVMAALSLMTRFAVRAPAASCRGARLR